MSLSSKSQESSSKSQESSQKQKEQFSKSKKQVSRFGQAFINYGSYHYDTTNKIIHIICIPLIAATLIYLLSYVPFNINLNHIPLLNTIRFGAAELLCITGIIYYIYLSPLFGAISGITFYWLSLLWKHQFSSYTSQQLFYVILFIQIFAWGLQFVGHGVFQKRKPALMDNFSQILNAPMFVMIQLCQLCGLRTKQIESWHVQIKENVMEYRNKIKSN